jgi:SAM-dependent methyltransferase
VDYGDYKAGASSDFFWFRGKRGLIRVLLEKVSFGGPFRILNAGAGTGDDISVISEFGEVFVVDTSAEALEMVPDELVAEKRVSDVTALSYADNSFDLALAFDLFEHVEDDARAVAELLRVLRPGGHLLFTVPAFNFMMSRHDRRLGHFRRYDMRALDVLLKDLVWRERGYWMTLLFPLLLASRLMDGIREPKREFPQIPGFINSLFSGILAFENGLIRAGLPLPVGSTIYGICIKPLEAREIEPSPALYNAAEGMLDLET